MLSELDRVTPDTAQLGVLTRQLAALQIQIQQENIRQYLALKRVCTPGQAQKLSAMYRDLYGCPMKNGKMQHRNRHGQGGPGKSQCE